MIKFIICNKKYTKVPLKDKDERFVYIKRRFYRGKTQK